MTRVVMEYVEYELNVPETGVQPDSLTFVEIDQEKCIGCDTCQQYCPTGAIYGETFEPHTIKYRELCINCGQCLTHCPSMAIYEVRSWVPKLEEKPQGQPREMRGPCRLRSVRVMRSAKPLPACRNC